MPTRAIACPFCIHFNSNIRDRTVCTAFPNGIPDEIKFGYAHHTEPWPGDNGIRFEPKEGYQDMTKEFEEMDRSLIKPGVVFKRQIPWDRARR